MRINELILEQQQLDELSLKGLGTGLGKAVGAVAGGAVQGAKNVWSGAKQGYQAAQQAMAPDGADTSSAASGGWGTPTPTTPAPTTNTTAPANTGGPGEVASNNLLARAQQGTTQDPAAQTATTTPPETEPAATTPPPAPTTPASTTTEPPVDPKVDQQSKIGVGQINKIIPTLRTRDLNSVKKNVDATLAKKAKPAPAAAPATTAPAAPTQAELDADQERMASGTNESKVVVFRSKFLGMDI
jgi:hypothetical protein